MQKIVIIGAGANGAGCIGRMMEKAGYHITFIDSYSSSIDFVKNGYRVEVVGLSKVVNLDIKNVKAYRAGDTNEEKAIVKAIAGREAVFIVTGVQHHSDYSQLIEKGLEKFLVNNSGTKNLIFCENRLHSGKFFKHRFLSGLFSRHNDANQRIGLVDTVIHINSRREKDKIVSEEFYEIPYDADAARGAMPVVPYLKPYHDFERMEHRKLFLHNLLTSATACPAYLKGIERFPEVSSYPNIINLAIRATDESISALEAEYGGRYADFNFSVLVAFRDHFLQRLLNPLLNESVVRHLRRPNRKLAPDERMVGPALLAEKHGIKTENIARVIACALKYNNPDDPQSIELQQKLHKKGIDYCLTEICGLKPDQKTYDLVKQNFLKEKKFIDTTK